MKVSLSLKITIFMIVAVLLQVSVVLYYTYKDLVSLETNIIKANVESNMARLQQSVEFLWKNQEINQIQSEVSHAGSAHNMRRVVFVGENNLTIASSRISDVGGMFTQSIEKQSGFLNLIDMVDKVRESRKPVININKEGSLLEAVYSIELGLKDEGENIVPVTGFIYSSVDLLWIHGHVKNVIIQKSWRVFIVMAVIGLIFLVLINRSIVRKIQNVNEAALKFVSTGYKSRAVVSGNDELAILARSFNKMADIVGAKNKELESQEENISLLLNFMDNGVVSIDEKGIIHSVNQSFCEIFEYSENELLGKNINILMPEPLRSEHDTYIENYINTGKEKIIGKGRDVIALRNNNQAFDLHLQISEMPEKKDRKRMFVGTCMDITQYKQQELLLRHSQKMDAMGKLTGGVAHDYNNMLGVILGYAELIREEITDENSLVAKYVDEIFHAGTRGAKLTKKLLSFSKQKALETVIVDLNKVLSENKHMLEKTLTVRVDIQYDLEDPLWVTCIDVNDFEDALLNICINAMHAMDGQGKIDIKTRNKHLYETDNSRIRINAPIGDYVWFSVCDTGSGISDDIISKIFDPFFTTKEEKGNGLGLSQVYGFVNRSEGYIDVHTETGNGTCFELYFPRCLGDDVSNMNRSTSDLLGKGTEDILVVDDEISLAMLLQTILKSNGYNVVVCGSAKEALEILDKEKFDLLISDVLMPEMDGYQLANISSEKYPDMKIQLVSGYSGDFHTCDVNKGFHATILHKPFDKQDLLHRVRLLLDGNN